MKQYKSPCFTDTNSVICKIIVGDGFPVPREAKRLPYEMSVKGERYMKATGAQGRALRINNE